MEVLEIDENDCGNKRNLFSHKKLINLFSVFLISFLFSACLNKPEATTPKNHKSTTLKIKPVTYQNEIFWNVTVDKSGENKYLVKGKVKSQISSFNYSVEDGHYQLLNNIAKVSKNNPEWGVFDLTFSVTKKDKNTTLILALFDKTLDVRNKNFTLMIPLN